MRKAFTLMELVVVVLISSVMASAAITSYMKTIEIAEARNAILIARTIQAAEEMYLAKNDVYWPEVDGTYEIDDINAALGLSIDSGKLYIWCDNDPATGYTFPVYDCCFFYPASNSKWKYEVKGSYKYPASVNITGAAPIDMPVCMKSDDSC